MKILKLLPLFLILTIHSKETSSTSKSASAIYDITKLSTHTFDFDQNHHPVINNFRLIYEPPGDRPNIFFGIKTGKVTFKTLKNRTIRFKWRNLEKVQIWFIDPEMLKDHNGERFLVIVKEE